MRRGAMRLTPLLLAVAALAGCSDSSGDGEGTVLAWLFYALLVAAAVVAAFAVTFVIVFAIAVGVARAVQWGWNRSGRDEAPVNPRCRRRPRPTNPTGRPSAPSG